MNRIEERYRRVLRMLPTAYRLRWEEEMVEAFLASVETDDPERAEFLADFGRPDFSEVASVVALSLRLRLGLAGTPTPRSLARVGAWRIVALAWLLVGATLVTAATASRLWATGLVDAIVFETEPTTPLVWRLLPLLWIVAFFALLLGRLRVARVVAVLLVGRDVLSLLVWIGAGLFGDGSMVWMYDLPTVLVDLCAVPALWAFTPGRAVAARRSRWVLAYGVAVVVVSVYLALGLTGVLSWAVVDIFALYAIGMVAAALVHLARRRRDPAWTLGLAMLVVIVLAQRLVSLPIVDAYADAVGPTPRVAAAIEIAALVLLAVPLMALSARALARLPSDPSPTPAA
jgi:hypothetical protein